MAEKDFPSGFDVNLPSDQLHQRAKGLYLNGVGSYCILADNDPLSEKLTIPAVKSVDKGPIRPPVPVITVENIKEAVNPDVISFVQRHPISVVKGLTTACEMEVDLFSTKTIVKTSKRQWITVLTQYLQEGCKNLDSEENETWYFESVKTDMPIEQYAAYVKYKVKELKMAGNVGREIEDAPNDIIRKTIQFGTNVDLSDEKIWNDQLEEINKLPPFFRLESSFNMLFHVEHPILGMNTVQLYLKVPGCRTPGHQENNNFCSINLNVGPGDSEWFAVANEYWGIVEELCKKNGVDYLSGSWWPNLKDLEAAGVPVFQFTQKAGDLVFVNTGCVHWVQALGTCNNIAWNVGPMTSVQYKLAAERYEYNKTQNFKSLVPMVNLSWNMAKSLTIYDEILFTQIKTCMMHSLVYCHKVLEYAKAEGIQMTWYGKEEGELTHYCEMCSVEMFNFYFIKKNVGRNSKANVYCLQCAQKENPSLNSFEILMAFELEELHKIYDKFTSRKLQ